MEISGFQSESYQDWDKGLSSVVYTGKCNLKCPACHANNLLKSEESTSEKDILKRLDRKSRYIKRLTISGGEPTLEKDILNFLKETKKIGYKIKLDSNGTNPKTLEKIKDTGIVDYIAMDIKASREFYENVSGNKKINIDDIEKSISTVSQFPDYEFRTTVVPIIKKYQNHKSEKDNIKWMNTKDVDNMASWVFNVSGKNPNTKYFLQRFKPVEGGLIDSRLEKWDPTPRELMGDIEKVISKYFPKVKMRGME